MDEAEQLAWLKLVQLSGVNREGKQMLLDQYRNAPAIFDAGSDNWKKFVRFSRRPQYPDDARLAQQVKLLNDYAIKLLPLGHSDYPTQLVVLPDAPIVLFTRGDRTLLARPQLAVVGSRSASPAGLNIAEAFAKELAQSGLTVTSGLALGIDAAAHRGALNGIGSTVAVVATGLDQVYPRRHATLMAEILEQGVVVSEFAPLTPPRREAFPQRNRLISGLSAGVLVVEAGVRSGSLITARLAGEQGREIFAVPGSIHNPTARGCHQLIRQGAKLVETTQDILEELKPVLADHLQTPATSPHKTVHPADDLPEPAARVFALIDYAPTAFDTLAEQSALPIEEISSILLQLELDGRIAPCGGGQYQRLS